MPTPAIKHDDTRDPNRTVKGLGLIIAGACIIGLVFWLSTGPSFAKTPRPIPAPAALVKERAECQAARSVEACLRSRLRTAYASVEWQRHERLHQGSFGVDHAIRLASALYGVPVGELRRVGTCESHLHPASKNSSSTASGLFQFLDSTWVRAGVPGFSVFDPYANAIAAARLVKSDGSWREWSCRP